MNTTKVLRLVLGDQLNYQHPWFTHADADVTYVMMELRTETDYTCHHIQKVAGFFAAMRAFAAWLASNNHNIIYLKLNDSHNLQCFDKNIQHLIQQHRFYHFEYLLPDEYRIDALLQQLSQQLSITVAAHDTAHFFTTREELGLFFAGKKQYVMESFYHYMRKKHNVLMDGDKPATGQWNYDTDNRKKIPASHKPIAPLLFHNDVSDIVAELCSTTVKTIGTINPNSLPWPVNREQSLTLLQFFVSNCLPLFGTFQDAMSTTGWSLYHSRLSFSLNTKMISPAEVINEAISEWEKRSTEIQYNQLEGFVRQIIGWREYMRGIYWLKMPQYASLNYFNNTAPLPQWYWTGDTKMNCLKHSIKQSLQHAYAHHIQRLMITGNFALLAGVHPDELDQWYLGIYIDAIEWVEITNTRGMSQFADGGIVGTKPYISSAAYIDKMSNYCGSCHYNKASKTGDKACPFNSLYWHFYNRHEQQLSKNPRVQMMYKLWQKMQPEQKAALLQQADYYLQNINTL